jgi:hypothetical protein
VADAAGQFGHNYRPHSVIRPPERKLGHMPDDQEQPEPDVPDPLIAATEQADEYDSLLRPLEIPVKDGVYKVRHPNMLDDEAQELFEQLQFDANQCDRWPDVEVPENNITLSDGTTTKIGAHTQRGDFMQPYQKDGVRMTPGYNIRLAKILLGETEYEKFKARGGRSNQVAIELSRRARELRERQASDPKSDGSNKRLAAVPDGD